MKTTAVLSFVSVIATILVVLDLLIFSGSWRAANASLPYPENNRATALIPSVLTKKLTPFGKRLLKSGCI